MAAQLVEEAQAKGSEPCRTRLLAEITNWGLELGLEVDMNEHLGSERYAIEGRDNGDSPQRHEEQDGAD